MTTDILRIVEQQAPVAYRFTGRHICPCGHPTIVSDVEAGKLYDAWPQVRFPGSMTCGSCELTHDVVLLCVARERGTKDFAFLPESGAGVVVLEPVEGGTA